jgi:dihydropteroate synthase
VAIDTWKPEVAEAAIASGAVIVNDTGGLKDPEMRRVIAANGVAAIAVWVEGENPHAVGEIEIRPDKAELMAAGLGELITDLASAGIDNVIVDPGIALNYRGDYESYTRLQLEVITQAGHLESLGRPLLIPIPRKRDGHRVAAYIALALEHGADIIRVHDVAMACDLTRLFGRSVSLP